jgi:hypothetical protein
MSSFGMGGPPGSVVKPARLTANEQNDAPVGNFSGKRVLPRAWPTLSTLRVTVLAWSRTAARR